MKKIKTGEIYSILRKRFGFLDWWPGDTRDEVIIGAILTQNTAWVNVEKAIANLKQEDALDLRKISGIRAQALERMIRPSGFFRQKAKRLKAFADYVCCTYGGLDELFSKGSKELRKELLSLDGIGMETADSIILYAANKPVFVIDAYTRRIMSRLYGMAREPGYEELQESISRGIREDVGLYKDFHAQFVTLGKNYCRKEPLCGSCPLLESCARAAADRR